MSYTIYAFEEFLSLYETLDSTDKIWIQKIKLKLIENPTGKILHYDWFREKKYLNKRLYFLVDEDSKRVILVYYGTKKHQQKIINSILANKENLLILLKETTQTF